MSDLRTWVADNWQWIVGFLVSTATTFYVALKRVFKIERDIEELKKELEAHIEDDKATQKEIKADLKEIRQDIKQLLARGR